LLAHLVSTQRVHSVATMTSDTPSHTVLDSSFPVLLPEDEALFLSEVDFQALIKREITEGARPHLKELEAELNTLNSADSKTLSSPDSVSINSLKRPAAGEADNDRMQKSPFIAALEKHQAHHCTTEDLAADNRILTENCDVTNISARNPLVDLFYDLGENTEGPRLKTLLDAAWKEDSVLTLKIIINARSIHLGKSNKVASYKAFGWLAENHPLTLLKNLPWLVRPIIPKKATKSEVEENKAKDADEDFDMIGADEADPAKAHDVQFGMSHGYWKDLLNLVVFAANDQLKYNGDPFSILTQRADNSVEGRRKRNWDQPTAKAARHQRKVQQNEQVQAKLKNDPFYRALHVTVARLFAEQLKQDKFLLASDKKSDMKKLSLAAKWAPTFGEFHDKHTFILSSIAEILFPDAASSCPDATDRELYLRHIREHYRRQYVSPLRKALSVVERDIAANTFDKINYERVPSLAMDRYTNLFMKKDYQRFKSYVQSVAQGSAKISGATLLPSTLISKARAMTHTLRNNTPAPKDFNTIKAATLLLIEADVIDCQWNTLVQRVRDLGCLTSSLAICDVSGSMSNPSFSDGSCPMDSAIGLSLLIASVTTPPFGTGFISFSETSTYISLSKQKGLVDTVEYISRTPWGYNTDFVAVFEKVILPMAVTNQIKQEDMVKQVFVFSDMQFDTAQNGAERWSTSYERIKAKFLAAGYEMPRLIFWNLACRTTDKPITMGEGDTALVSGYSQGMLKAFLEEGVFGDEEEVEMEDDENGVVDVRKKKVKADPLSVIMKAVGGKAYAMLEVVD
jgi:hypothetical protein